MEVENRLQALVTAAQYDVCGYSSIRDLKPSPLRFIHKAALPGGGHICLFKVLQTNVCTNDCAYCVNQIGRDCPRTSFRPEELAGLFMQLYRKRMVRGLFLSSGIAIDPSRTMERMIETVEVLRNRHQFNGYIHLKILPGASSDCVEEGCKLASRVSVNMEAPTPGHLARLSSKKDLYQGIVEPMRWVKKFKNANEELVPSGQTTQFVVGAAGENDREILNTTVALYREVELRRVYYSPFSPVRDSRLEGVPPAPPIRAHRLYQADWLLRVYGFPHREVELALRADGNLPLKRDPKLIIAEQQPWLFPVDVNRASYDDLLRVPGIGPVSAQRIVEARQDHSIDSLTQLKKMRVVTKRAVPYVWFQSMLPSEKQASFIPQLEEGALPEPTLAGVLE